MYKEAQIQKHLLKGRDEYLVIKITGHSVVKSHLDTASQALATARRHAGDNINHLPTVAINSRQNEIA